MSEKFDAKKVDYDKYKGDWDNESFWDKIKNVAKIAGKEVILKALTLYYTLVSDRASAIDKAMIIAALGYFICPTDAVPDFLPVIGYSDDLAVLVFIISKLHCINDEIKALAKEKLAEWFD